MKKDREIKRKLKSWSKKKLTFSLWLVYFNSSICSVNFLAAIAKWNHQAQFFRHISLRQNKENVIFFVTEWYDDMEYNIIFNSVENIYHFHIWNFIFKKTVQKFKIKSFRFGLIWFGWCFLHLFFKKIPNRCFLWKIIFCKVMVEKYS